MVNRTRIPVVLTALSLLACNLSATTSNSGGVKRQDAGGSCGQGTVVLLSDFLSTQIALSTPDGTTLSPSFLSTASTKASNLAFALSGDVVLPSARPVSGKVVLLDRYGTNVVTWADPFSGQVLAQLPVGTGFESNPQDYLELDASHAYVTRWGVNSSPGKQSFDSGSDVLAIDIGNLASAAITASIAMPGEGLPPRPSGMVHLGDTVVVVLQRTSEDFMTVGESALVGIKNGAVAWSMHVAGLQGCGRPALSPSGTVMALACQGQLAMDGTVTDPNTSAVVLLDVTSLPPALGKRFPISDQIGSPPQNGVAFATETLLIGKTQTPLGGATDNQTFSLDLGTGKATVLLTAGKDAMGKGKGVVYGDVLCRPGCGDVCLLADADVGKLRRWKITGAALQGLPDVTVESMTGLPPQSLGEY